MHSTRGWNVSGRRCSLNGLLMTRLCTARPSVKPDRCGRRWPRGWRASGCNCTPIKTKIVYCKDDNRRGSAEHTSFTFLGDRFCPRAVRSKHGRLFTAFVPAISPEALAKISGEVRRWRLHQRTGHDLNDLAERINPIVRGWMNYYGRFFRSEPSPPQAHQRLPWGDPV